jgi:2-oxoglutarate ferredoxin oxidoreductase subunit alpha
VLAPASPADCFTLVIEAMRIAVRHMTPVFILSEGFLANSSEPWRIPPLQELEPIVVRHPTEPTGFQPYSRTPATLARPWVLPGTPGMEHRLGGLEKQPLTGNVSYAAADHETMCRLRADKIARIAGFIPDLEVAGHPQASLLLLGWGGSYGAIRTAVERLVQAGRPVACAHLRYLNPFPANLGEVLAHYGRVLVPELNHGQLALLLRARYLVDVQTLGMLQGRPFSVGEIEDSILEVLDDD